jgi:putative redox protein
MRFAVQTGTGRVLAFGDRPEANEHSPVELLSATLAACSAMDVLSILEKKRQVVASYSIAVEAIQRDAYPQILTRIDVVHELSGTSLTEAAVRRAIELSATKYCPVSAMLSAGDTEIHHGYRIASSDPEAPDTEGEVVVTGPYRRPDPIA